MSKTRTQSANTQKTLTKLPATRQAAAKIFRSRRTQQHAKRDQKHTNANAKRARPRQHEAERKTGRSDGRTQATRFRKRENTPHTTATGRGANHKPSAKAAPNRETPRTQGTRAHPPLRRKNFRKRKRTRTGARTTRPPGFAKISQATAQPHRHTHTPTHHSTQPHSQHAHTRHAHTRERTGEKNFMRFRDAGRTRTAHHIRQAEKQA